MRIKSPIGRHNPDRCYYCQAQGMSTPSTHKDELEIPVCKKHESAADLFIRDMMGFRHLSKEAQERQHTQKIEESGPGSQWAVLQIDKKWKVKRIICFGNDELSAQQYADEANLKNPIKNPEREIWLS